MTAQSNHIISKLTWQNSFNKKDKAIELQQRISSWSKTKMQQEITRIFDKICPTMQTWSIQSLTLNLGCINYDDLESELSVKIAKQLEDKIFELITAHQEQNQNIVLLNPEIAQINMLRHFFITGTMPWNYAINNGTINEIMENLLQNDKQMLIKMLHEVGIIAENVRKRMAWQLHEPNIIKIIEGLETSNHTQIVDFSNQLTQIQQQGTLVQANKNDFKKNLWFWILNYLFTDRGTIFNKVAFMKSSIKQMSNHYNVEYKELLTMIEMAINQIHISSGTRANFIQVLNMLTIENENITNNNHSHNLVTPNYWTALNDLFNNHSIRKDNVKKMEFNDLVIGLSKKDKTKFRALFTSFGNKTNFWTPVVNDLNNEAIEAALHAVIPVKSQMLIETVYFIQKLTTQINLKIAQNVLWEIAIEFALQYNNSPFDNKMFLHYTIDKLSKKDNIIKENLLNRLTSVKVPSSSKNIVTQEIYANLTNILNEEIQDKNEVLYIPQLTDLLLNLYQHITSNANDKVVFVALQKSIINHIYSKPSLALNTLINYKNKTHLIHLLPYLLNDYHAQLWVKKSNNNAILILQTIDGIMTQLSNNNSIITVISLVRKKLFTVGVSIIILRPGISNHQFIETLIEKLFIYVTPSQKVAFDTFLEILFSHKKIVNKTFSQTELIKIKERLQQKRGLILLQKPKEITVVPLFQTTNPEKNDTISINGYIVSKDIFHQWIENAIKNEWTTITHNEQQFAFKDLIDLSLALHPKVLRDILCDIQITQNRIKLLRNTTQWSNFSIWIVNHATSKMQQAFETLQSLYQFVNYFSTVNSNVIQNSFWQKSWELIQQKINLENLVEQFIQYWLDKIFKNEHLNSNKILETIQVNRLKIDNTFKKVLVQYNDNFLTIENPLPSGVYQDIMQSKKLGQIKELYIYLLIEKRIPTWYNNSQNSTVPQLFQELLTYCPTYFINLFKQNIIPQLQRYQWFELIDFKKFINIIQHSNKNKQQLLTILEQFHIVLGQLSIPNITSKEIQNILFKKIVTAWTENNWSIIAVENCWQELIWEISHKRNIPQKTLIEAIEKVKYSLPPALQITFEQVIKPNNVSHKLKESAISPVLKKQIAQPNVVLKNQEGIAVKNAGIVLLNNYIPILFDRLDLLKDGLFKNNEAQLQAVHHIQYVITGLTKTEEILLPLNKVLCGLPVATPVMESIQINDEQKKLISGLINAAISHWPSVGDTSINGFRGNWLVREGLLVEKEEYWELTVEKKIYDLLIYKSPFSFSIIKYPWMSKSLRVIWPY